MSDDTDTQSRQHILDFDPQGLATFFTEMGEKAFRAKQVIQWAYEAGAVSFDEMTNLSKPLREKLAAQMDVYASKIIRRSASKDGTVKLLLEWPDGETSECVLIPAKERVTACISSQVGCPVGCRFCASGMGGLKRNLTCGEIVEQAMRVRQIAAARGERLSNIVVMGLGEPLANLEAVIAAVTAINAPWGMNIGARRITISTVGLPKQIRRLAEVGIQFSLALSVHAPTDALRKDLIPWAENISLQDVIAACRDFFERTGREITLEYVLLDEVNDRRTHAEQLARLAKSLRCNVNLIRYNPVEGLPYRRPTNEATMAFHQTLRDHGVNVHIRTPRGTDIDAACGQLRRRAAETGPADDADDA